MDKENDMRLFLERFGMPEYRLEYTPGTGPGSHTSEMDLMQLSLSVALHGSCATLHRKLGQRLPNPLQTTPFREVPSFAGVPVTSA